MKGKDRSRFTPEERRERALGFFAVGFSCGVIVVWLSALIFDLWAREHGMLVPAVTAAGVLMMGAMSVVAFNLAKRERVIARRAELHLCTACGYDLRATPEKGGEMIGRCPECGSVDAR